MKGSLNFKSLLFGVFSGFLCCFFMLCSTAFLVLKSEIISDSILSIISLIILALSSFFSGFIAGYSAKKQGLIYGSICGLVVFLTIFIGGMIAGNDIGYEVILKGLIGIFCSITGSVLGVNKN